MPGKSSSVICLALQRMLLQEESRRRAFCNRSFEMKKWKILLTEFAVLFMLVYSTLWLFGCQASTKVKDYFLSRSLRWVPVIFSKTKDIFYGSSYFCGISQSFIVKEVTFLTWGIFLHWSQSYHLLLVEQRKWTIVDLLDRTILFKHVLTAPVSSLVARDVVLGNPFQPIWGRFPCLQASEEMNLEMVRVLNLIGLEEILTCNR